MKYLIMLLLLTSCYGHQTPELTQPPPADPSYNVFSVDEQAHATCLCRLDNGVSFMDRIDFGLYVRCYSGKYYYQAQNIICMRD